MKIYLFLSLLFFYSCNSNDNSCGIFKEYPNDSINHSFFKLNCDSVIINEDGTKLYKFEINLYENWKILTGYFNLKNDSLFYLNDEKHINLLTVFRNEKLQTSSSFNYKINRDTIVPLYFNTDNLTIVSNPAFYPNNDTVYKIFIKNFSVLINNDNLVLYLNRKNGIIGLSVFIEDSTILYFNGAIFSDSILLLKNKNLYF